MKLILLIGCLGLTLGAASCSKKSHQHSGDHSSKSMSDHMHADHMGVDHMGADHMDSAGMHSASMHGSSGTLVLTHKGAKIAPAVSVARIPAGAWYCEMSSKVHFARLHKGDGKCSVCGMSLKKK